MMTTPQFSTAVDQSQASVFDPIYWDPERPEDPLDARVLSLTQKQGTPVVIRKRKRLPKTEKAPVPVSKREAEEAALPPPPPSANATGVLRGTTIPPPRGISLLDSSLQEASCTSAFKEKLDQMDGLPIYRGPFASSIPDCFEELRNSLAMECTSRSCEEPSIKLATTAVRMTEPEIQMDHPSKKLVNVLLELGRVEGAALTVQRLSTLLSLELPSSRSLKRIRPLPCDASGISPSSRAVFNPSEIGPPKLGGITDRLALERAELRKKRRELRLIGNRLTTYGGTVMKVKRTSLSTTTPKLLRFLLPPPSVRPIPFNSAD